jgi:PAP2 superfamily
MARSRHGSKARRWLAGFTTLVLILGATLIPATSVAAVTPDNTVIAWNRHAVEALSNPLETATPRPNVPGAGLTPPVAAIHLAMVQGAVYDAVNAIDRGHTPYLAHLPSASRFASKAAAAATAAHHVLVGLTRGPTTTLLLPAGVRTRLDNLYNAKIRNIRNGAAKRNGIRIGAAVAAAMLANRATDGRYGTDTFTQRFGVGQWRVAPGGVVDPNGWVRSVRPFTLVRASQFRSAGPLALSSVQYGIEYNEVKTKGGAPGTTGLTRTPAETEVALFHSGDPLIMLNRGLRQIAAARGLSIVRQARLFVMATMSSADGAIGCWDSKWAHSNWRPITAIRDTADDGNGATFTDPAWTPLRPTPPYPDVPSGYNCFAWSYMSAVKRYFATDNIRFSLTSTLTLTTRSYTRVSTVLQEALDGRVWNGLHFRMADNQGALLGQKVAGWIARNYFKPVS